MANRIQLPGVLLLSAQVRSPIAQGRTVAVRLRIDTGAVMAILDPRVIRPLGLTPIGMQRIQGVTGASQTVPIYRVTLDLGARGQLTDVQVAALALPARAAVDGLFGDNLLRRGRLIYDGPAGTWSFEVPRPGPGAPGPANR